MRSKFKILWTALLSLLMILLILDSKTGISACSEAIDLCIKTIIPGVFPFLVLSSAISTAFHGLKIPFLERLLHIPTGSCGYFLIGLLCGYPVGAKLLQDAFDRQKLSAKQAQRMMVFCNNASPAFIIGILASVLGGKNALILWLIQISASLLLGVILPATANEERIPSFLNATQKRNAMTDSIKAIASICGWVLLFQMGSAYLWPVLSRISPISNALLTGVLELTNGLFALRTIQTPTIAFVLAAGLFSFGGLCVLMQTKAVAPLLSIKTYISGKLLHAAISTSLAAVICPLRFSQSVGFFKTLPLILCAGIITIILLFFNKKVVAFPMKM